MAPPFAGELSAKLTEGVFSAVLITPSDLALLGHLPRKGGGVFYSLYFKPLAKSQKISYNIDKSTTGGNHYDRNRI